MTLLLAAVQTSEKLSLKAVTGSVLALVGIVWMVLGSHELRAPPSAIFAMLGAALAIGQSIIMGKRLSINHPVMTNAVGMSVAALLLLTLSASADEVWALPHTNSMWRWR